MESVDCSPAIGGLIGESDLMREVRRDIEIAASLDLSVLIVGEPGTGKELVARGLHDASSRRDSLREAYTTPVAEEEGLSWPSTARGSIPI